MKLRIEQRDLAAAAKQAHRRLPSNPANPVLGGLLIESKEDGPATLSGFDLEVATRATLDADTLEPGIVLVSGRLLADVAAAMPAGPVDLVADDREIILTAPGTVFTLPTMEHRDYPALPKPPEATGTVDGTLFAKAVTHAAQASMPSAEAVGTMEGFAGVHILADDTDELVISASDRYRIVRHRIPWSSDGNADSELLIPADGIAATAKAMAGSQIGIAFPAGGGVASLATDRLTVTSRTIASGFPNINVLFPDPDTSTGCLQADAAELMEAVRRAALVNETTEKAIVLTAGMDTLSVSGGGLRGKGVNQITAQVDGLDGLRIGYQPAFLGSLLAPIDGQVRLWLTTPTKPVLIEPVDDDTYRAVCMPIRLK
ncbi:DNA polymerase III subunit beta [Streptomyces sp. NPDC057677]|uniref:DNA polymerase III subunit beta n=1 Tax=unclassified Streptomyces TaxID=2593676 RepID=UPI0036A73EA9